MRLNIAKDIDELSKEVAVWIITYIEKILKHKDDLQLYCPAATLQKNYTNYWHLVNTRTKLNGASCISFGAMNDMFLLMMIATMQKWLLKIYWIMCL